ncbi:MAG: hypothetical protein ACYC2T_09055 [Bacillota bacterium]
MQIQIKDIEGSIKGYPVIADKKAGSTVIRWNSIERLTIQYYNFLDKTKQMGLTEEMLHTLYNLSFSEEEILNLSPEEIAEIFAPGTQLDGGGFDPDPKQTEELGKIGIDTKMSMILYNLDYEYDEMLGLSAEEIDFIFPNTELMDNLQQRGYSAQEVNNKLKEGKNYKEIIKEAFVVETK